MKKKVLVVSALISSMLLIQAASAIDLTVGLETWLRYDGVFQNDMTKLFGKEGNPIPGASIFKSASIAGDTVPGNSFYIPRCYINILPKFDDNWSGRLTVDIFNSSGTLNGTGIRLKYGWAQFQYIPDQTVSVGLLKTVFGQIDTWDYPIFEKSPEDQAGFVTSADFGGALQGYLPFALGDYSVMILNGEGYQGSTTSLPTVVIAQNPVSKDLTNTSVAQTVKVVNTFPSYMANVSLYPISGVMLRGSAQYFYDPNGGTSAVNTETFVYTALAKIGFGAFNLALQWAGKDVQNVAKTSFKTSQLFSACLITSLKSICGLDMDVTLRADYVDPDAANDMGIWQANGSLSAGDNIHDAYTLGMIGLSYNAVAGCAVQLAWERKMPDVDSGHGYAYNPQDTIVFQVKLTPKATISN